jgi:FkbM family methyltransferase
MVKLSFFIKKILKIFNIKISNYKFYEKIYKNNKYYLHLKILKNFDVKKNWIKILDCIEYAKSELGQDILALNHNNFKKNGYFIEIGAGDGKNFSNTHLLEKKFNWRGILVEPYRGFQYLLKKNRKCIIENKLIYHRSDLKINFYENLTTPTLSSIYPKNIFNKSYKVSTVTFDELLKKNKSPKIIDYLSIDIEGNELKILKSINFKNYKINVITVEHNYQSKKRENIYKLLKKNGYIRIYKKFSHYDDYYIKKTNE